MLILTIGYFLRIVADSIYSILYKVNKQLYIDPLG
jgi:hypothetical protein